MNERELAIFGSVLLLKKSRQSTKRQRAKRDKNFFKKGRTRAEIFELIWLAYRHISRCQPSHRIEQ